MTMFGGNNRKARFGPAPTYGTPPFIGDEDPNAPALSVMFGGVRAGSPQPGGTLSGILANAFGQAAANGIAPGGEPMMSGMPPVHPMSSPDRQQGLLASVINDSAPTHANTFSPDATGLDLSNATVKKPGFFHHGGLGEKILHWIGEVGLRYSAGQGDPYATMVLRNRFERQQQQVRLLEQVKQRQSERDEWLWRENYKRDHPDDQFSQYMRAAGIDPSSPEGQAFYRQRAETMATPPTVAVDGYDAQGNPTKTFMPRTGFGGRPAMSAPSGPATGTVRNGYRFNGGNPNDRNSWVPVGGASSGGGATFR